MNFHWKNRGAISSIPMTSRSFASDDFIGRGRSVSRCAILTRGFAVRQKLTDIGDRQIVSLHGSGDVLNFQNAFLEFSDYDIRSVEERHGARRSPAVGSVKILSYPVVRALAQS